MKKMIPIFLINIAFGQLSLEISTDTTFYVENQNIEITLSLINQSSDTIHILFPYSMPYWIFLDNSYLWGGGGIDVIIPQTLAPHASVEWQFVYDEYLNVGDHFFSASIVFYPTWTGYDTLIYLYSNPARFHVSEYLGMLSEKKTIKYSLISVYPNPFNASTTIQYTLLKDTYVELDIFTLNGALVQSLVKNWQKSGTHSVIWNGVDTFGNPVSSGIYFCVIRFDNSIHNRKIILQK